MPPPLSPQLDAPASAKADWCISNMVALVLLTCAAMMGHLDRVLFGYVMPQIKAEMMISDTVLGLLAGLAFTVLYLVLAIPLAWLADKTNRRLVIVIGLAFWSVMTFVSGLAGNVWQLAASRVLVGAGESTNLGPSKSLVSDLFGSRERPVALSLIAAAPTLSGIALVPMAGWIAEERGWRDAFFFAGITGLVIALLLFALVREPPVGGVQSASASAMEISLRSAARSLVRSRPYVVLALASACMTGFTYTTAAWESSFLVRVHGFDINEAAQLLGFGRGLLGIAGLFLGGVLAARLGPSEARRLVVAPIAAFALAATEAIFLLTSSDSMLIGIVLLSGIFYTIHVGIVYNVIASIVVPRLRGVAIASFIVVGVLIGQTIGPFFVGALSDLLQPSLGVESIRYSLFVAVGFATLGGILFSLSRGRVDAEIERVRALTSGEGARSE